MIEITGNHPYADEFPMASEDELAELAESIATVGLIHPLVLTPEGLLLDGRNRREACQRAGVEPHHEIRHGDDNDYKEFVIGVNTTGRRESMTIQIAAASAALILGKEKRINGQWRRGTVPKVSGESATIFQHRMKECGLVLDILGPDGLRLVRDGDQSFNAVYEFAITKRDEKRTEIQRQERVEAEEVEAKAFIEANAPELAARVTPDDLGVYKAAYNVWEAANKEEAERIARDKAREEMRRRDTLDKIDRYARMISANLTTWNYIWSVASGRDPNRDEIVAALNPQDRKRYLLIEKETVWTSEGI